MYFLGFRLPVEVVSSGIVFSLASDVPRPPRGATALIVKDLYPLDLKSLPRAPCDLHSLLAVSLHSA
jgi:hypothetical protein